MLKKKKTLYVIQLTGVIENKSMRLVSIQKTHHCVS